MPGMSDNFDFTQTTQALAVPELPALNERWTMRRKAALVFAVRSGRIPVDEACRVYKPFGRRIPRLGTQSRALRHPWPAHDTVPDLPRPFSDYIAKKT